MSQQKFNSNSTLPKGCGCLLLALVGVIGFIALSITPLFFSFGINDKQVEIFVGTSFLDKANNSKQSEAKQYVGSMNRAQQAKFAEDNAFATSVDALGLGIKTETNYYKYSLRVTQTSAFSYAVAKKPELKNYFGGVFLVPAKELYPNANLDEVRTVSILCQTEKRPLIRVKQTDEPAEPIYQNGEVICGKGTTLVSK